MRQTTHVTKQRNTATTNAQQQTKRQNKTQGAAPVAPAFVGYDMIETTLRAYQAGAPPQVLRALAPHVKALWAPATRAELGRPYAELSDYEKVMVDAYEAGDVSLDAFRPLEGADARRRAAAAAAAAAAQVRATACSLLEALIAAALLGGAAFAGSAALAGLEARQFARERAAFRRLKQQQAGGGGGAVVGAVGSEAGNGGGGKGGGGGNGASTLSADQI